MRISCILCVRRKSCPDNVKDKHGKKKNCPAKVRGIRADK